MTERESPSSRFQITSSIFTGILFISTASIFIRFAQDEASSIVIAFSRLFIASLILIPIAWFKYREDLKQLTRTDLLKAGLSGLFLALHFASWITSLRLTSVASSVVLVTTTPLWVALLSPLVLKEHLRKPVLVGLIVSILGSVIVGLSNTCEITQGGIVCSTLQLGGRSSFGNFLALFGAWMAAGYMLIGRQLRKKVNTISYTAVVYGVAAFILLILVVIRREPVFSYPKNTYLWLLALGIFPQLIGHSLFNWALKYISASYVSLTLLGEPIGTIILTLIFLKEKPTLLEFTGALLIFIGIIIGSIRKQKD